MLIYRHQVEETEEKAQDEEVYTKKLVQKDKTQSGKLVNATRALTEAKEVAGKKKVKYDDALKKVEQKHFELFLALLKSICDVTVFSNNPGIDLHLKLRGKKNHEGFHCLCGLISASTVLYNNFSNAE